MDEDASLPIAPRRFTITCWHNLPNKYLHLAPPNWHCPITLLISQYKTFSLGIVNTIFLIFLLSFMVQLSSTLLLWTCNFFVWSIYIDASLPKNLGNSHLLIFTDLFIRRVLEKWSARLPPYRPTGTGFEMLDSWTC